MDRPRLTSPTQLDKAGRRYWDDLWEDAPEPAELDLGARGVEGYVARSFDALFRELIGPGEGRSLVEVGCGGSAWLPYFARELGYRVSGIDYSEPGCERAQRLLERVGVDGVVLNANLFDPPSELVESFDVAVSLGVVEHFADTSAVLTAIARLVRPGGLVLTLIPNLSGAIGIATRVLNRRVYDKHVPLTEGDLRRAHESAALRVRESRYFLSTGFGVANLQGIPHGGAAYRTKAAGLDALKGFSKVVLAVEIRTRRLPATGLLAPYAVCVAEKA